MHRPAMDRRETNRRGFLDEACLPVVIPITFREEGYTSVHTHSSDAYPAATPLSWGTPSRNAALLVTGRLELAKYHRLLLDVVAKAKRGGRSLTPDVFGDEPLRKALLGQTRSLDLEEQVRFRRGFWPDVCGFRPGCRDDGYATYSGSSSPAIIEAMAAGLQIVAENIGGIAEPCDHGAEARVLAPRRPGLDGGHADRIARLRASSVEVSRRRKRAILP